MMQLDFVGKISHESDHTHLILMGAIRCTWKGIPQGRGGAGWVSRPLVWPKI